MEREHIGIKEVDAMIQGGLPQGSIVGLSGPPGVGKSIFAMHYLLSGARKGQKCVYINLEEPEGNVENMIHEFSFHEEFVKFVHDGKIVIKCYTYPEYEKIYSDLLQQIRNDSDIKRLAIDSFNVFFASILHPESLTISTEVNVRRMINQAFSLLRKKGLTTLLVLEAQQELRHSFFYNIPYLVDGMIALDFLELGTIERRIFIPKMRWTNQYKESKAYEISKKGIVIVGEK
jgi:KaiC/GvpD/RAD55 family RecA-like ATPase